jgi:hypothetical protein
MTTPETRFPFYSFAIGAYMEYFFEFRPYQVMNITASDDLLTQWIATIAFNNTVDVNKTIDGSISVYIPFNAFARKSYDQYIQIIAYNISTVNQNNLPMDPPPAIVIHPTKTYDPPSKIIILNLLSPDYEFINSMYIIYSLAEIIDVMSEKPLHQRHLLTSSVLKITSDNTIVYHRGDMGEFICTPITH